jgi:nitroimidazol reductase NimA-like FMN-containing flavoprotein (pyridoxamine 5'-phosphate oxidase superfamily)
MLEETKGLRNMRRDDKAVEDPVRRDRLLATAPVGRIATVGPDGPMVKPVNFLYRDGAVYIHSATAGEKIDHLVADPRVCFQVEGDLAYRPADDRPCDASYAYLSIVATGRARFVDDAEEKSDLLNGLMAKYQPAGGYRPVTASMTASVALIRIDIERMTTKASPPAAPAAP